MQRDDGQRRYVLEGIEDAAVEVDVETFIFKNSFDPEVDPDAIRTMAVGEEIRFGGGAGPLVTLRRAA